MYEIVGNDATNSKRARKTIDCLLNLNSLKNEDYRSKMEIAAFFCSYLKQCNELSKRVYLEFLLSGCLCDICRTLQMNNHYIERYFDEFVSGFAEFHQVMLKYGADVNISAFRSYILMVNMSIPEQKIMDYFSESLLDVKIMTAFIHRIDLNSITSTSLYGEQNEFEAFLQEECI